jgi:hypothetical protein
MCRLQTKVVEHAGTKTEGEIAHGPDHVVDERAALGHGGRHREADRSALTVDASELHAQSGQHLADVIVQFPR